MENIKEDKSLWLQSYTSILLQIAHNMKVHCHSQSNTLLLPLIPLNKPMTQTVHTTGSQFRLYQPTNQHTETNSMDLSHLIEFESNSNLDMKQGHFCISQQQLSEEATSIFSELRLILAWDLSEEASLCWFSFFFALRKRPPFPLALLRACWCRDSCKYGYKSIRMSAHGKSCLLEEYKTEIDQLINNDLLIEKKIG